MLPQPFIDTTRRLLGDGRFQRFADAFRQAPPVSLRVNPAKWVPPTALMAQRVPWCADGCYLDARPQFTFDPLLHAGCYYVQEAASMFVDHVLRHLVTRAVAMLDLCAAPGGKTTCARTALPAGSLLVSNEPVRQRAAVLSENVQKWGHPHSIVTSAYPHDYSRAGLLFDVVLCDVPCSGEGMFRRDEATIAEWSPQAVERCQQLQRDIVAHAWQCLQPGGLMVYSTCTLNTLENEDNVLWAMHHLGATLLGVPTDDAWAITGSLSPTLAGPVYRFIPGITRSEGLFVALLRKAGPAPAPVSPLTTAHALRAASPALNILFDADAAPASPSVSAASSPAASRKRGHAALAVKRGSAPAPRSHQAAQPQPWQPLSTAFDAASCPVVPLTYAQAIAYLRREALQLPPDTPRGLIVVAYDGHPLGYAKNIGPRANNLYPQEWRIRSTHLPTTPPQLIATALPPM